MKVIGLTGGIGSGKSTVSRYIAEQGIPVIDADKIAREAVLPDSEGLKKIIEKYGEEYLLEDGNLDRVKMGALVFNNQQRLKELNSILHPIIKKEIKRRIELFREGAVYSLVVVDVPLLIEAEMMDLADSVWLVYADPEKQIERIIKRDGLSRAEALSRISSQMPMDQKKAFADEVIDNGGEIEDALKKVDYLINKYK